ncbi:MAG TPA: hypothetical protein VIS75_14255 [Chitinophagaceae bacterium]
MIRSLRKRHLQIWALWAVLIPVGIIVAWMAVPKKVTQELFYKDAVPVGSPGSGEAIEDDYTLYIRYDTTMNQEKIFLQFINRHKLKTPPLLIYKMTDSTTNTIDKQLLLGRIDKEGSQFFPLDTFIYNDRFILYDFLHKKIIDTITVKSPFN